MDTYTNSWYLARELLNKKTSGLGRKQNLTGEYREENRTLHHLFGHTKETFWAEPYH